MRPPFTDIQRLKRLAKRRAEENLDYLERYYEERFGQSAFSGTFEQRSAAAWHLELLTDAWRRRLSLQRDVQAQRQMGLDDKQVRLRMRSMYEQMRNIDELFAEVAASKEITREWDAQMERGQVPDLDGHLQSLKVSDSLKAHLDRLAKKA